MNDWQKMDQHASNGEWDQALAIASRLKHQNALAQLAGNFQIPPSHINSFLQRIPRNDISDTIYQLSENLHPDLSSDDLYKIWNHSPTDYLVTKNITKHPNLKIIDAGQRAAGEFWNSYETKISPSHFAAIKSALTGEPESLESHRGTGHSSAHELQIPHLIKHMENSQRAILKDPTIPKQYINGEPHLIVYRGVGGSYGKAIKDGLGIKDEFDENRAKSTIERHKTVNVPTTHMASWSINREMATRFAGARGEHDSAGNPHLVVMKKLVPLRDVLHTGMHSLYPGHFPAHANESEVVLMHPSASYKISSKDVEVAHPDKSGIIMPEHFKPVEKKTIIKKSEILEAEPIKKSEDFFRVSSVIVATDDKMLMLQRRDNNKWTFPGGHLNDTETHLEGAVRELWEEAGIRANPDEMILLGNKKTHENKDIRVYVYKVGREIEPSASNDPDKEAKKFEWLPHVLSEEVKNNLYIPIGDNASLSMFSMWLLRQKTNKLKKLIEVKKSV